MYFRETPLIDAGGRFAYGAVPEYMVFDKEDMGAEFIKVNEEGMEKSKKTLGKKATVSAPKPTKKAEPIVEDIAEDIDEDIDDIDAAEETTTETASDYPEDLVGTIRVMFKDCADKDLKAEVKGIIAQHGKLNDCDEDALKEIYDKLK